MSESLIIHWFRQDLRLADNPAMHRAAAAGRVLTVFVLDDVNAGDLRLGAASRWWLHHSLAALNRSLQGGLLLLRGDALELLPGARRPARDVPGRWPRGYREGRDFPGRNFMSRLSPALHFGELSPNQLWYGARAVGEGPDLDHFLSELGWREFAHALLFHHPTLPAANLQSSLDAIGWQDDPRLLAAWRHGQTGIPFVDAGMRELWGTGWDAQPGAHGDRFVPGQEPAAALARRRGVVPRLPGRCRPGGEQRLLAMGGGLPGRCSAVLRAAGVEPGETCPRPVVDLAASRGQALAAYAESRGRPHPR